MPDNQSYSINDQKYYLLHLGTGKWSNCGLSRRRLLQLFLDTAHLRSTPWPRSIIDYAQQLLKLELEDF